MSVKTVEKLEKSQVVLTIEVDANTFEAAVETAYRKNRGQIRVPGFRPGKAPRKTMERMFGANVFYNDAIDAVIPDAYVKAIEETQTRVVGYPEIEVQSVSENGVVFTATVALYPEVKLGQYKGLEAVKTPVTVTAADVDARLNDLVRRNSRMVSVERPVENGDIATIDFEGFDNGEAFEGGKGENYDLEIGSGSFVPGFEEQVIGMNIGEEKDINLTFPSDYHADLAGKPVVFHVKVNAVKTKEAPALDDEFAKDVSEFDTLDALKADLEAKVKAEREEASKVALEDALMEKLGEGIEAEIPNAMVEMQIDHMIDVFKRQLAGQGIPYEQYLQFTGMTEAKFREEARDSALGQVKMDLAVEALIKEENLSVSEEEVAAQYQKLSEQYKMDVDTVKQYVREEGLKDQLLRDKVIALVVENATVLGAEEEKPKKAKRTRKPKVVETAEKDSVEETESK